MKAYKYISLVFTSIFIIINTLYVQAQEVRTKTVSVEDTKSITHPKPINFFQIQSQIEYPLSCRRLGIEGKMTTKILVDKDGLPKQILFIDSLHPDLKEACELKLYDLRFIPAKDGTGNALERWVVLPFYFRLSL